MQTITTYNGIKLGLVEVPKDAYDFKIYHEFGHTRILWFEGIGTAYAPNLGVNASYPLDTKWKNIVFDKELQIEIIGTTSTLTNEQVEFFIEHKIITGLIVDEGLVDCNVYKNYLENDSMFELSCDQCTNAKKSFNSLLEANNIDLSKEYVILKLLNKQ